MITKAGVRYEVFGPWADVDQQPTRGLSQGLPDLAGKTIGLLCNHKYTARPILRLVEEKLKERYPTLNTSWHKALRPFRWAWNTGTDEPNDPEIQEWANELRNWSQGVDAVIAAVGD
ncbi:MAG: hypothetical protein HYX90_03390 [Chloroflexi bacterium]|nr:hypothetical protein [Chloroflexota bacterium]